MQDVVKGLCVLGALLIVLFFVICVSRFTSVKKQREQYPESLLPGAYRTALILCCIAVTLFVAMVVSAIVAVVLTFDSVAFM